MLVVTNHVETAPARLTSWWGAICPRSRATTRSRGTSGAISLERCALSRPSVSFMMFDLVAQATLFRPSARGELERQPDDLSPRSPCVRSTFRHWATPGVCMLLDGPAVEILDVLPAPRPGRCRGRSNGVGTPGNSRAGADVWRRSRKQLPQGSRWRSSLAESDRCLERALEPPPAKRLIEVDRVPGAPARRAVPA